MMDSNNDNDGSYSVAISPGTVQMFELVTAQHTTTTTTTCGGSSENGTSTAASLMDIQHLLKLMDICTCASAEKHTGVNCVTVSMGDVVFEHVPHCGEMIELTARPVLVGRTSLDIALTVIVEGVEGVRKIVCEAVFTYVTTKGPNGEKRFCPPLDDGNNDSWDSSEQSKWEKTIASYRRALVHVERKQVQNNTASAPDSSNEGSGFDLEMSEVVLPAHQNHMGHTFGGVVMAWMAKAALVIASRKSKRSTGSLSIRSVLRVDFQCGSDVSDHLIFRPRITAIFDNGRSAEVEVRVSKRSISTGVETHMNVGYFYVSGSVQSGGEKTSIKDKPFCADMNFRIRRLSSANTDTQQKMQEEASWRRRLLLARRRLLGGIGDAVEWHPSLHEQAPLLTIMSVLRLVHHNDPAVTWIPLILPAVAPLTSPLTSDTASTEVSSSSSSSSTPPLIEWTSGQSWGRKDTFVLRATGILVLEGNKETDSSATDTKAISSSSSPVQRVFNTLKNERCNWDEACISINILETQKGTNGGDTEPTSQVKWDVVEHIAKTPIQAVVSAVMKGNQNPETIVPFSYLRTWKIDDDNSGGNRGGKGDESSTLKQTTTHPKTAILASQSVVHSKASPKSCLNQVLPSGWFLKELSSTTLVPDGTAKTNNSYGVVEVTYIVEHDLNRLRHIAVGMPDEIIVETMASMIQGWFNRLATYV